MLEKFHRRFGVPGVISVLALALAMTGGAFAAQDQISGSGEKAQSSAKKKAAKGKRGPKGPKGATGPAGPAGPAGAKGDAGAAGAAGAKGETGAQGANGAQGAAGAQGEQGDPGAQGPEGDPWTAGGVLPPGETETGAWYADGITAFFGSTNAAISFAIPLSDDLIPSRTHAVPVGGPVPAGCTGGTAAAPKADAGHLCVYAAAFSNADFGGTVFGSPDLSIQKAASGATGASTAGARVLVAGTADASPGTPGSGYGTWAVTAPPAP